MAPVFLFFLEASGFVVPNGVETLGDIGGKAVVVPVFVSCLEASGFVVPNGVGALADIGGKDALYVAPVFLFFLEASGFVVPNGVEALGDIGGKAVVVPVFVSCLEASGFVAPNGVEALTDIGGKAESGVPLVNCDDKLNVFDAFIDPNEVTEVETIDSSTFFSSVSRTSPHSSILTFVSNEGVPALFNFVFFRTSSTISSPPTTSPKTQCFPSR